MQHGSVHQAKLQGTKQSGSQQQGKPQDAAVTRSNDQKGWTNHLSICSKNLSFHLVLIHIRAHHMFLHQYPIYKKQKITISTYKLQLEYLVMQSHSFDFLKHSPQIFNYWPIQKL